MGLFRVRDTVIISNLVVWIFYMEKYYQEIAFNGRNIFYMKK